MSQGLRDRTGDTVDRYRLVRLLGAGGFGAVYAAQHIHMQRAVALKLLHAEQLAGPKGSEMRDRFLREAQAAAAIGHPGIVQVYDCGVAGDDTFVAMELLEGEDLDSYLKRHRTVTPSSAVAFVLRLLDAVGAAHRAGIVHRDLKPANIFLVKGSLEAPLDNQPLKLLDFGISKVRGVGIEKITRTGMVMGTPHYMAPEMFMGVSDVDGRADLYAVGAVLYEMLTARTPHNASSYEHLVVQAATTPAPSVAVHRANLPRELIEAVDRALRTDPADRYASAEEFADALRRLDAASMSSSTNKDMLGDTASFQTGPRADSSKSHASPVSGFGDTQPAIGSMAPPSRRTWRPVAGAALVVVVAGLGLAAAWSLGAAHEEPSIGVEEARASSAATNEELEETSGETPLPEEATQGDDAPVQDSTREAVSEASAMVAPSAMNTTRSSSPNMRVSPMLAAPPAMNAAPPSMNAAPPRMDSPSVNATTTQHETRPGRVRVACGSRGFESDMYLAGPATRIRVSSGRQSGVTESTTVLRETVQTKAPSLVECFGAHPIPIGQNVDFHVGPRGVVSNVSMRIHCPIPPQVQRCIIGVFESVDFSAVQRREGDARVGFSPQG